MIAAKGEHPHLWSVSLQNMSFSQTVIFAKMTDETPELLIVLVFLCAIFCTWICLRDIDEEAERKIEGKPKECEEMCLLPAFAANPASQDLDLT